MEERGETLDMAGGRKALEVVDVERLWTWQGGWGGGWLYTW